MTVVRVRRPRVVAPIASGQVVPRDRRSQPLQQRGRLAHADLGVGLVVEQGVRRPDAGRLQGVGAELPATAHGHDRNAGGRRPAGDADRRLAAQALLVERPLAGDDERRSRAAARRTRPGRASARSPAACRLRARASAREANTPGGSRARRGPHVVPRRGRPRRRPSGPGRRRARPRPRRRRPSALRRRLPPPTGPAGGCPRRRPRRTGPSPRPGDRPRGPARPGRRGPRRRRRERRRTRRAVGRRAPPAYRRRRRCWHCPRSRARPRRTRRRARPARPRPARDDAVIGASTPPGSRTRPHASAISTTATGPRRAYAVATGSPVGPATVTGTRSNPAAIAASRVPSPPSATGRTTDSASRRCDDQPASHRRGDARRPAASP